MRAVIKHNGVELPEALCLVNTASNIVTLETMDRPCMKLNMEKLYVRVSILGDLKPLEEEED